MANIQVMRFETKAKLGAQVQLVRHIDGSTRPETASSSSIVSVHGDVELGAIEHLDGEGMGAARAALDAVLAARSKKGRPPKQCVDFLFAGPPPYTDEGAWSPARELEWGRETNAALRELVGPNSIIVTFDLHRDEASPHTQGVVVPIDSKGRLGWCHVRDEAAKRLRPKVARMRKDAQARIDQRRAAGEEVPDLPPPSTKSRYGVLQDWLYYRVSRRFGLDRGLVGSEAQHEQIDRQKAVEASELRAQRELDRALGDYQTVKAAVSGLEEKRTSLQGKGTALEEKHASLQGEVDTLTKAKEERGRNEAVAGGLFGRRSQKGLEIITGYEARIASAETQRDGARAELATRTSERDRALDVSQLWERKRRRAVVNARRRTSALRAQLAAEREVSDRRVSSSERSVWRLAGAAVNDFVAAVAVLLPEPVARLAGALATVIGRGDSKGIGKIVEEAGRIGRSAARGSEPETAAVRAPDSGFGPGPGL